MDKGNGTSNSALAAGFAPNPDSQITPEYFAELIQRMPHDFAALLRIAWCAKNQTCNQLLLDHAISSGQADALVFAFLPVISDWTQRVSFYETGRRLLEHVQAETLLHLLRAANPDTRPDLAKVLNVDEIWKQAIEKFLRRNALQKAYECLLDAGTGFLRNKKDPGMLAMSPETRAFLLDAQTWKDTDAFFPTYSRANDIADLIRLVWEAHRKAGGVESFGPEDCMGSPTYEIAIRCRAENGAIRVLHERRITPYRGLIARFAVGRIHSEQLPGVLFVRAPTLQNTTLRIEGAMLQQLVHYYLIMVVSAAESQDQGQITELA